MKIRHLCPFCAIPAISIAIHVSVTNNFLFLTVFNQFFLLLFCFYQLEVTTFRSNNFVVLLFMAK